MRFVEIRTPKVPGVYECNADETECDSRCLLIVLDDGKYMPSCAYAERRGYDWVLTPEPCVAVRERQVALEELADERAFDEEDD
jgi:hypothetical protein